MKFRIVVSIITVNCRSLLRNVGDKWLGFLSLHHVAMRFSLLGALMFGSHLPAKSGKANVVN